MPDIIKIVNYVCMTQWIGHDTKLSRSDIQLGLDLVFITDIKITENMQYESPLCKNDLC